MAKTRDPRPLMLKLRVIAPAGQTRQQVIDTLLEAARTGELPDRWKLRWMDWGKGTEGVATGRMTTHLLTELQLFVAALTHPHTRLRAERPEAP